MAYDCNIEFGNLGNIAFQPAGDYHGYLFFVGYVLWIEDLYYYPGVES